MCSQDCCGTLLLEFGRFLGGPLLCHMNHSLLIVTADYLERLRDRRWILYIRGARSARYYYKQALVLVLLSIQGITPLLSPHWTYSWRDPSLSAGCLFLLREMNSNASILAMYTRARDQLFVLFCPFGILH